MQYKNEEDFAKALKAVPPKGVYLLYGSESFLVGAYAKRITGRFGGDFSSFNLQRLDGRRLDCDLLFDTVETLPLMAAEKCVLLDDIDVKGLSPAEMDKLAEILGDVPPFCVLVVTAKAPAFDARSAAAKKLIKLCAEAGAAVELGSRSQSAMVSFLRGGAKKLGCELPPDLARYMLQTCETDMGVLTGELAKVCAYAGPGELTRGHIDAVVNPRTEARVFDLGKAILAGNTQRAMELLSGLFYLREQPLAILAALTMSYVDLYRARVAKDSGKTPADVIGLFGYKGREFRVNNAWNSRVPVEILRRSLETLLDCDRRIKSTGVDDQVLLEQTVIGLFALQRQG